MGYSVAAGSAKAAMVNAGFCAFSSHAAVSALTCDGDFGRFIKSSFSDKAAKNVILAAVTAGICHQMLAELGLNPNSVETAREGQAGVDGAVQGAQTGSQAAQAASTTAAQAVVNNQGIFANVGNFSQALAEQGVRGVVSNTLQSCTGDNASWQNFTRTWAANTIGQWGSGEIGDLVNISPAAKTFFHGFVGGTSGSLMGGTGCVAAGIAGGIVGETLCHNMIQNGVSADEAAKIARIMSTIAGIPIGGNPGVAHATATNAVTNNSVPHALAARLLAQGIIIVGGSIVANAELVQQVMRYLGINIVGNGYTVGDRAFASIKDAVTHVVQQTTLSHIAIIGNALLEKIEDGPIIHSTPQAGSGLTVHATPQSDPGPTVHDTPISNDQGTTIHDTPMPVDTGVHVEGYPAEPDIDIPTVFMNERGEANIGVFYNKDARKKISISGVSGKEGAKNVPSWARGERPNIDESGKDFADRLLGAKYGIGKFATGPRTEHNQIKKWGDRSFTNPK